MCSILFKNTSNKKKRERERREEELRLSIIEIFFFYLVVFARNFFIEVEFYESFLFSFKIEASQVLV
jgi:hypothetical protein